MKSGSEGLSPGGDEVWLPSSEVSPRSGLQLGERGQVFHEARSTQLVGRDGSWRLGGPSCNPRSAPWAAGDQDEDTAFDLFGVSNINRKTIGAKQFRGPDPSAPAYRFVRFDYLPPVGAAALGRIARLMRQKEGFFLTASLRQDRQSRGTLLALEGPGAAHRQFEIVSNGPADTLDLSYWVDGTPHVQSLEDVGLADAQWKNVTVQVAGETFSLHVGCELIDSFTLDEPFYGQLNTDRSKMYVAKGSTRESHFRVGVQDGGWGAPGEGPQEAAPGGGLCQSRPGTRTHTCPGTHSTHVHTHTHPGAHVHTHTLVHTCTHTCPDTHMHIHMPWHTCTHMPWHACAHTHLPWHTCTHVHTHLPWHTRSHTHPGAHVHTHTHTCPGTHVHTCLPWHIGAHSHTCLPRHILAHTHRARKEQSECGRLTFSPVHTMTDLGSRNQPQSKVPGDPDGRYCA